ncbi:sugar phosphate nucleotidyltransferase [Actinoplanes sp. NPDC049265]|uniref:sugar phosphate nucleotidyltransferase n=1 Tax=Actinoplanes sp. NPDC049265 TaxID=3363902 RepID=UPI0037177F9A
MILAAGEGRRLRPLTTHRPKALCPVGNVPLLDQALTRVAGAGITPVAVNAAYLADQVVAHVGPRAHLSVEPDGPLGTSGGVAFLRDWIDGRGVLVGNADGYLSDPARPPGKDIAALLDGWSGHTVRMLAQPLPPGSEPGGFSNHSFAGFSLLPWHRVRDLVPTPAGLVRDVWRPAEAAGELELIPFEGTYFDTGTPQLYLRANLHAAAGANLIAPTATVTGTCTTAVVGAGATVAGTVIRSVILPGATVGAAEVLTDAIRVGELTIPAA